MCFLGLVVVIVHGCVCVHFINGGMCTRDVLVVEIKGQL